MFTISEQFRLLVAVLVWNSFTIHMGWSQVIHITIEVVS